MLEEKKSEENPKDMYEMILYFSRDYNNKHEIVVCFISMVSYGIVVMCNLL